MKYFVLKNSDNQYYFCDFAIEGLTEDIYDAKIIPDGDEILDQGTIARIELEELCRCKFKNVEIEIKEII